MVAATLFLKPLVAKLAGRSDILVYRRGVLAAAMPANGERTDFARSLASEDGGGVTVRPLPRQDSSLLSIYASANALLVRPPHAPPAKAGEACLYVALD